MKTFATINMFGNVAADIDFRDTKDKKPIAMFPLATDRRTKAEDGTYSKVTDFHKVVAFGGLAEIAGKFIKKGMPLFLQGRLVNRSYDDKNGERHYSTEILAEELNILAKKESAV